MPESSNPKSDISDLQRKTPPWETGKIVRSVADFGVSMRKEELRAWLQKVEEEWSKKGKRK